MEEEAEVEQEKEEMEVGSTCSGTYSINSLSVHILSILAMKGFSWSERTHT